MEIRDNGAIRVLHITEMLSAAGIESFIMNVYRHIDRSKVQFDFLVLRDQDEFYEEEIYALGGRKYFVSSKRKNTLIRINEETKMIYQFLVRNQYDIVQIHYTTPLRAVYLKAAERAGVKTRIYHSHSAHVFGKSKMKMFLYEYRKKQITKWATEYFACSKTAAEWMYEKKLICQNKIKVLYNGIETDRFQFSAENRNAVRSELDLSDQFIIIHTGRFTEQKNQLFIIDILKVLIKKEKNIHLLLLGEGGMMNEVRDRVRNYNLEGYVTFLGVTPDVEKYLSAADCYVMPSLYEGLPVSVIEAECSGLPCVLSENITKEAALSSNVTFLSLEDSINKWSEVILSYRGSVRRSGDEVVKQKGYDVQKAADDLQTFYENCFINGDIDDR